MAAANIPAQSLAKQEPNPAELMERVLIGGDLSKLSPPERLVYYKAVCESVGLNPLTKPFEYITLNGKLTLYARKDATDQLRAIHGVSVTQQQDRVIEGIYVVTTYVQNAKGRTDVATGAVPIENLKGETRANAMMKCETKSKRRATLSICGLGMLDEMEVETIPTAQPEPIPLNNAALLSHSGAVLPTTKAPAQLIAAELDAADPFSEQPAIDAEPESEIPLISKGDIIKVVKMTERLEEYGVHEDEWRNLIEKATGRRHRSAIEATEVGKVLIALSGALNEVIRSKTKSK